MGKGKRKVPGLNQSSIADISFILLIFFLVTTSMDTDTGLPRRLPEWDPNAVEEEIMIRERNIMIVNVNKFNEIYVKHGAFNGRVAIHELKDIAKEFIANPHDNINLPAKEEYVIPDFKTVVTTIKYVILLQTDRSTSYETYFQVQNELTRAYNELRDEWCRQTFGKGWVDASEDEQTFAKGMYPSKISEAEPRQYGTTVVAPQ